MDYYKRKEYAQNLVKKMLADKENAFTDNEIKYAVEDQFQLSYNWTQKYLGRLRGE